MASVGAIFNLNANLIGQLCVVIYSRLVPSLFRGDRAIQRSPKHFWMCQKAQKQTTAKAV